MLHRPKIMLIFLLSCSLEIILTSVMLLCFKVHERKSDFRHRAGGNWSLETFPSEEISSLWHFGKWLYN